MEGLLKSSRELVRLLVGERESFCEIGRVGQLVFLFDEGKNYYF